MKGTAENGDKFQTSTVQGQSFPDTTESQEYGWNPDIADDGGDMAEGLEGAVERPEGTDEPELGHYSPDEHADGELEGADDDDQVFLYPQGDQETGNGLAGDGGDEGEDPYVLGDGSDEDGGVVGKFFSQDSSDGDGGVVGRFFSQDNGDEDGGIVGKILSQDSSDEEGGVVGTIFSLFFDSD
jgi:hypothetical protein